MTLPPSRYFKDADHQLWHPDGYPIAQFYTRIGHREYPKRTHNLELADHLLDEAVDALNATLTAGARDVR